MTAVLPALGVLLLPALIVLWVRRPRCTPLTVVTLLPAPTTQTVMATPDLRTAEQKLADQARVNEAWGLR